MDIKVYTDNLYKIMTEAGLESKQYYQTFCGSPHLFLSLFNFLSKNKETEEFKGTYTGLREILNKYGIDGKLFKDTFLMCMPAGAVPAAGSTLNITSDRDYDNIKNTLKQNAIKSKRPMDVTDLILTLFSEKSYSLFDIFSQITKSDTKTEEMYEEIIKKFKSVEITEIQELEQLPELININKFVKKHPQVTINADNEINKILMALSGRSIRNCVLTGPAGVGKTTYVYELAQRINKGDIPVDFAGKVIYELNTASLVAGTRYRGDFEEKLMNILDIVKDSPNVIIFIDELHTFLSAGDGVEGGSQGAGNIIKPYISRGEVQIIGATTNEEYIKYVVPDKAFASRFHEIKISEPSREETKEILYGVLPEESTYFKKEIQENMVDSILDLSEKYSLEYANPRKAINMLELACSYAKVFEEKNEVVNVEDIIGSIRLKYNIFISDDKVNATNEDLHKVLLGQDKALSQVVKDLKIVDRGITDNDKPLLSMLLCGPTGTGKTETAKIIAKNFFGNEDNLVKINCGEYSQEIDVSKLTGSAPGYAGYDDEPDLIKQVRQKPNSIVLFDEIEKAHPSFQKILLNILDCGEMKDNKGNRVSFRNCIIVFTTNLGCTNETGKLAGAGLIKTKLDSSKADIMKAIDNYFLPEFLARLDDIVYYDSLTNEVIEKLINRYLSEYKAKDMSNLGTLSFTKEDIDNIIKTADIASKGARSVRRAVRKQIIEVENRSTLITDNPVISNKKKGKAIKA